MRATLLTSAVALFALAAFGAGQQTAAQQQQTTTADTAAATTTAAPQATTTAAPAPAAASSQDSPLVAAAKRTGRLGKTPTNVITNDTLAKSGGHFTTTKDQQPLDQEKKAAEAEKNRPGVAHATDSALTTNNAPAKPEAKKTEKAKKNDTAVKQAAAAYEGDSVDSPTNDPATQEGVMAGGGATKPTEASKPAAPRPPSE